MHPIDVLTYYFFTRNATNPNNAVTKATMGCATLKVGSTAAAVAANPAYELPSLNLSNILNSPLDYIFIVIYIK